MDVSQYLEIFIDETKEHIQNLSDELMVLEKEPENMDTINEIFRAAHSLKGMAGTMGYKRMQTLTHDMENVFSEVRDGKMKVSSKLVDILFQGLDALEAYLDTIINTANEGEEDNQDIIDALNKCLEEGTGKSAGGKAESQPKAAEKSADSEDGDQHKYKELKLAEHERNAALRALDQDRHVYGITVKISEGCLLKAARAFLVFKALEELGEIIKSVPDVPDIEDEKFDFDFSIVYITKESKEKIHEAILNVSEIHEAYIGDVEVPKEQETAGNAEEGKEQSVETQNGAAAATAVATAPAPAQDQTKKTAAKQAASKPIVNRSVRVDIEKLDVLMNLVSELIIAKNGLVSIGSQGNIGEEDSGFNEQIEYLERVTTNLHESVMKVRMMPIESVVSKFPRMIRELNKKLGKKMELYMTGEDTELDRTVIDEIGDPLMHLLRNSADHGLESNAERVRLGKPEVGSIFLDAYQDGNNVVIEVRDDGAGINVDKVRDKAIEKGTITPEQAETMTDKDFIDLLFRPSFSTADAVTDVSGRGVGLDVVKSKIEGLGGEIFCKSVRGEGSTFTIQLPLTLAIIQALMVELGTEKYAIPLGSIETIEDVLISDIKYVQTREVINLRGTVIPLIRLDTILDIEPLTYPEGEEPESITVVIVAKGDKLAGLVVDDLIGQQEIVIKSIGKYINNNKIISGATILGDGEVALIIDANTLV